MHVLVVERSRLGLPTIFKDVYLVWMEDSLLPECLASDVWAT